MNIYRVFLILAVVACFECATKQKASKDEAEFKCNGAYLYDERYGCSCYESAAYFGDHAKMIPVDISREECERRKHYDINE